MRNLVVAVALLAFAACGDDSGLVQKHEDCSTPGDEDGNGLADCDDPVCLEAPECTSMMDCGDGLTEGTEECDDGNFTDGDGCDHNCTDTRCGNGIMTAGEACDDGNTVDGDGCDSNCQPTGCGNGERAGDEQCDDGNTVDGDGCEADCTLPACGNGIVDPGEGCDDGNLVGGDGCDANCQPDTRVAVEVEPNDDRASADANDAFDTSADLSIQGTITAGDLDDFAITNSGTQPVVVDFDTWNAALGPNVKCGAAPNTTLDVLDATGATLGTSDDRDAIRDTCSSVRGIALAPGDKVYARVEAYGATPYQLGVTIHRPHCGDHYTTPDEQCDDGNTTAGDGCDATCHLEGATPEVEPNNTISTATVLPALPALATGTISGGDGDVYAFTLAAPTTVAIETFTAAWTCGAPIALQVLDATGTTYSLATTTTCAHVTATLPAGTTYAEVLGAAGAYVLAVTPLVANTEAEPDDSYTAADDETGSAAVVVAGDSTLGDDDYYAITVPAGAAVRAEIIEGAAGALGDCDAGALSDNLTLYDATGTAILSEEDRRGRGTCALIDGLGDSPADVWARNTTGADAIWYLDVDKDGLQASTSYRLAITVR